MARTTNWILRAASLIVITFGTGLYAKPFSNIFANYNIEKIDYKNSEWAKKYLNNPKSYCEKLVGRHIKKNSKIFLAMNQNMQASAKNLFDECQIEGGAKMSGYIKCQINAQYFDYTKDEINKTLELIRYEQSFAPIFLNEIMKKNLLSCDKKYKK